MSECKETVFEQKLAYHTAPALLGIKPACLFSASQEQSVFDFIADFNQKAACKGLKLKVLCVKNNRLLIMLYNQKKLELALRDAASGALLRGFGYREGLPLELVLQQLSQRFSLQEDFPHEIGIFLGYPIEDVHGFIKNGGADCKFCGYWKVYGDVEKAKRTFNNYNKCRNFLLGKLNSGYNLYHALKITG